MVIKFNPEKKRKRINNIIKINFNDKFDMNYY